MDRMSALDAGFLQLETDVQQMHVGSALLFEGPVPGYDEVCDVVETRLDDVPRYRQRVQRMPWDLARPVWVDDPHFNIRYHVRHTAVPAPGDDVQLRTLAGRLVSQRLDMARPLWEMWLVEGLSGGRWALVNKAHHAMIDGVSGHDVLEAIVDRAPGAPVPQRSTWRPRPAPSRTELVRATAAGAASLPVEAVRAALGAARDPSGVVGNAAAQAYGIAQVGRKAVRPTSVLNGPLGPHRRWGWARGSLEDAKRVKNAVGCTVNDVVLAAIAGGFRTYLAARGESVEDDVVRTMVPVSIRTADQRGRLGNQVTAMFAELPIGTDDPADRLALVAAQMNAVKGSGQSVGVEAMLSAADFVPPTLLSLGARVAVAVGQRVINTVTTNIPGPQFPLYFLGREMLEMFPYIPLGQDVRITIGIVSYHGHLAFGVTGDYDQVDDLEVLCDAIEASLQELVDAVA